MVAASRAVSGRLVVVTGAARGVGFGICQQVLEMDPDSEVVVLARSFEKAAEVSRELGSRAHPGCCDVRSEESCRAAAAAVADLRRGRPLSLINNAGVGLDLPWMQGPWPASTAQETLDVNLHGAWRITEALLPELLDDSSSGRVIFVSSGAGPANMKKMGEERRDSLLDAQNLSWQKLRAIADAFVHEYEVAAKAAAEAGVSAGADGDSQAQQQLPCLSASGFWLQSYGFSKACLNAYCRLLARDQPRLICATCSPGFVDTDMVKTYSGDSKLRSVKEGGDVPAWLACSDGVETAGIYNADRSKGDWVAQ
eukprot:TRINITY_DN12058_c0_g1_i2.p1 TRINITY_DN12058_c0_g1~~TRINITY_DN12058_c0_g1_i2.p1  ORF type:complete len:311 (+),score=49.35 TRINITY_DN12058_c0_g1_i2:66-998(+)